MHTIQTILQKNSVRYNEKYTLKYLSFIEDCRKIQFDGYTEKHHIIPKSFKGTDDSFNIIVLSARHHYVAHLLLMKATGSGKMIKSVHRMMYSKNKVVKRDFKISSKMYGILRKEHIIVVSKYSKNTVLARQIYTGELSRIPKKLFDYYKDILYEGIKKNSKDTLETRQKKSIGNKGKSRKVYRSSEKNSISATQWEYKTPKGYCKNFRELFKLYPSFTGSTLDNIRRDTVISCKFVSIHKEFAPYIGKTFSEYGIIRVKRKTSA